MWKLLGTKLAERFDMAFLTTLRALLAALSISAACTLLQPRHADSRHWLARSEGAVTPVTCRLHTGVAHTSATDASNTIVSGHDTQWHAESSTNSNPCVKKLQGASRSGESAAGEPDFRFT